MSSALILAGGMGSRLGYREKALIDINGKPLISFVIESLEKVVDNIIISVRDKTQGELFEAFQGYKFAYDSYKNKGPLAGILSGLEACEDEYCFIAACDLPFINEKVVKLLFNKCDEGYDAAIPRHEDGFLEPLHAVYRCKPMIMETKKAIEGGKKTIILAPVFKLHVYYVGMDEIKNFDSELRTFMNINTREDIEELSRKCTRGNTRHGN